MADYFVDFREDLKSKILDPNQIYFIALRASAAVPPLICALEADLGGTGAGGRAVVCGATGNAAGARPR